MGFAFDTPNHTVQYYIDTWWASKDRTIEAGWDDAHGYIMKDISSSIKRSHY